MKPAAGDHGAGQERQSQGEPTGRLQAETFTVSFRACPHPIGVTDLATGRLVEVNTSFERVFGWTREEALGKSTTELGMWARPADRDGFVELMQKHGSVHELEVASMNRRGEPLVTRLSAEKVLLGGVPHAVTFVRDVTEQARTERALRESEEKFAAAFRSSAYAMCVIDGETGRFVDVNESFQRLFGHTSAQVLGLTPLEIGLWANEDDALALRRKLVEEGNTRDLPATLKTRTGEQLLCLMSVERVVVGGRARHVAIARDVTEQRRMERAKAELEAQLRQAQKLEALGTLAGGVAHDFNNILGAIVAYADLIGFDLDSPEAIESHLSELRHATHRARDLVAQILAFSRRQRSERKPLRPEAPVREALKLLRSTLPSTVQIEATVDPEAPQILADPTQIHQVVLNLGTNAAHAMLDMQGTLAITIDAVVLEHTRPMIQSEARPGRYARLRVRDTGSGMDEETKKRLFEPFFTTKRSGEGTGLGLAVVHGIVAEHDAHISFETSRGGGTVFELLFPEFVAEAAIVEERGHEFPRGRGQSILIVDDEQRLCESLSQLLERLGYRATASSNPIEALQLFQSIPSRFDVVLTDLTMPGMTGVDLTRALLELRPNLPIVVMSGFSGTWTADALRAVGVTDFVQKPVTAALLSSTLHRVLSPSKELRDAG